MKKLVLILMIAGAMPFIASAQKYNFNNLVGTWLNKEGAGLEVVDSSHIYVVYANSIVR